MARNTTLMPREEERIKQLLRHYGIRPSRRRSQNFMISDHYLSKIAGLARGAEAILEIGTGLGSLTDKLIKVTDKVITCDVDPRIAAIYPDISKSWTNADFIMCDGGLPPIRSIDYIVSNLPYGESSRLILGLLIGLKFNKAILTLQKEVAERLIAAPGSENYGRLSIIVQCLADAKLIEEVPPNAFFPRPKVYSAIIQLSKKPPCTDASLLEKFTAKVFTQPNKMLRKVINQFYGEEAASLININKRVYQLSPMDAASIINMLRPYIK